MAMLVSELIEPSSIQCKGTQVSEPTNQPSDYSAEALAAFNSAPWTTIPLDNTIPEQYYEWQVTDSYPSESRNDDPARRRIRWILQLEVLAPADYAGVPLQVMYFIGTEDDPKGTQTSTWMNPRGHASRLRRLTHHCGVPDQPLLLKGKKFGAFTNNSESDGIKYINLDSNFYHIGQVAPGTTATRSQRFRPNSAANNGASMATSATVECDSCRQQVPRADIMSHIASCSGPASV